MMIVLFSLLLLSVVGLGMMYSTNMETSINGNYRDKQVAFYAALAGLQEARDRIRAGGDSTLVAPSVLPTTGAANVIYLVSDATTVKPWDTTNTYFDTELCQEKVLSLSGTLGMPCTATASGSSWYQYFDDNNPPTGDTMWKLSYPLDWKWTRISLKTNNMTQYPVNGVSTNADQACWTGSYQMSTPTGYSSGCKPTGGVTAVLVTSVGSGYTSAPTVTLTGDGSGAGATASISAETTGYICATCVTITNGGSGYQSGAPPTVTFTSSTGSGATGVAVLSSVGTSVTNPGSLSVISMTTGGSGYTVAPTISFSGGGGSGATATAVLSTTGTTVTTGYVATVTLTTGGSGYTAAPTVVFTGGNGTGAAATTTLGTSGKIVSISVDTQGTQCYSNDATVHIAAPPAGGTQATATAVYEANYGCVYSIAPPGSNTDCTNKLDAAHGYSPTGQLANVTLSVGNYSVSGTTTVGANNKTVTGYNLSNPGYDTSMYTPNPTNGTTFTSYFRKAGGAAWTDCGNVLVTVTPGKRLLSITVVNGGSGYTSAPAITFTGGAGSTNPTSTATLGFPIATITKTAQGSGYTTVPTISFTGGGTYGTGGAATDTITTSSSTTYSVASITITAGGAGYTSFPTVTLTSSDGGTGAAAAVTALNQSTTTTYPVASVTISNGGIGYDINNPPTVTFSAPPSGTTATGTVTVNSENLTNCGAAGTSTCYIVSAINVSPSPSGSGYSYDPTVTISAPPTCPSCSTATATANSQISGGTKFGQIWMLTSLAQTKTGARAMLQMEVASPVLGFSPGGALTLDGPLTGPPNMPNSAGFGISGIDANSCGETADPNHPAIDGYDNPNNPTNPTSVQEILNGIPSNRLGNYVGSGSTPSVQNGYGALGATMTTPGGLSGLIGAIHDAPGAWHGNGPLSSVPMGTCPTGNIKDASCQTVIDYVNGDLSLSGNPKGYGILVVTGTLSMSGDFAWNGLILVIGDGIANMGGGGNAHVTGNMLVAKIWDSSHNLLGSVGSPTFNWNGGGGNGLTYDHCWSTDLMSAVNFNPSSSSPARVVGFKILPY
jgi:hypothetical protein